jgi:hypothetical protein
MNRALAPLTLAALAALAACNPKGAPERQGNSQATAEPQTVDIPQTVTSEAPGTTPMAQRVAVIGLLNKRDGVEKDFTLKPGQAIRSGDVIIRLRACETTAPWEIQQLTGAFVQLDVADTKGAFHRVFSGWLYKETPSLNVVQHPIYDVWPKSCAMTHPDAGPSTIRVGAAASNRSSAPNSAAAAGKPKPASPPTPATPAPAPSGTPADSASVNSTR